MLYIELYYFCTSRSKKTEGANRVNVVDIQDDGCNLWDILTKSNYVYYC